MINELPWTQVETVYESDYHPHSVGYLWTMSLESSSQGEGIVMTLAHASLFPQFL